MLTGPMSLSWLGGHDRSVWSLCVVRRQSFGLLHTHTTHTHTPRRTEIYNKSCSEHVEHTQHTYWLGDGGSAMSWAGIYSSNVNMGPLMRHMANFQSREKTHTPAILQWKASQTDRMDEVNDSECSLELRVRICLGIWFLHVITLYYQCLIWHW